MGTSGTERPVLPSPPATRQDDGAVRVPRAPVALSTASVYPMNCADGFAIASELGYDGVEVMVWTDPLSQDAAGLARLVEHYDLPVLAVHAPTLLVTQRVWGREPWAKLHRSCELALELGAPLVVVHPPFRWQREYALGFVEGVQRGADEYDVRLAVENMYPWRPRGRQLLAYAPVGNPAPHDSRDVTLDLSHTATAGADALAMARALGDRLAHVHLADGVGSSKD